MSLHKNGRLLTCDGVACSASASIFVSFATVDSAGTVVQTPRLGWLYVTEEGRTRHFCPECGKLYLSPPTPEQKKIIQR